MAEYVNSPSVVLHADDFGMNHAVNAGILRGFTHGLLTATSILTNAPAWHDAVERWNDLLFHQRHNAIPSLALRRELKDPLQPFELGVHLNLTQGKPVSGSRYPAALLDRSGQFPGIGPVFRQLLFSGRRFHDCIRREFSMQIERLLEHGILPTHLNGHQYVELIPGVGKIVLECARQYSISVVRVPWEPGLTGSTLRPDSAATNWCLSQIKRMFACRFMLETRRAGVSFPRAYFGTGHAGRVNLSVMQRFLESARSYATSEIGLHPGELPASQVGLVTEGWNDPLAEVRSNECRLLIGSELVALFKERGLRLGRLNRSRSSRRVAA